MQRVAGRLVAGDDFTCVLDDAGGAGKTTADADPSSNEMSNSSMIFGDAPVFTDHCAFSASDRGHMANHVVRQALEVATERIVNAVKPIAALAPAPFGPLTDVQWKRIAAMVESTRGYPVEGRTGAGAGSFRRDRARPGPPRPASSGRTSSA